MPIYAKSGDNTHKERVMVVDDSPGVLCSLVMLLRHFGFEVWGFADQGEAIAATREYQPDVLICDAHVDDAQEVEDPSPERIQGIKVASEIQHTRPECDVIIMSANLKPSIVLDHASRLGVRAKALPKPSSPESLISELRSRKAS